MVKIINGEIVQDDDPRALNWQGKQRARANTVLSQQMSHSPSSAQAHGFVQRPRQDLPQPRSPFSQFSAWLRGFGIPDINLGGHIIEPAISAAFVISIVLFGIQGLVIVGLLYYVFVVRG